jgi:tRNA A-37 threonylcarbamoyl transferase component Bud32
MMVGTQVGVYRVLQQIGEGGMGTVWLAEHTMLGRRAAIKLLHPSFSTRPDIVTRFFNEARAATAISDPGIVQIFDFGHHIDGTAYIAMEFLDGEPLDRRLRRLGRLPISDALRIMRQVASTLGIAHQRGIVHRDLKPENVILVHDPEVIGGERAKILDFGIAKLTGDQNVKTNTSAVMGTPAYMSPEQCRGAGLVDQRSDVYALGCMMFALITGAPPFDAEGSGEIIAMHLREPAPVLSSRVHGVSPELELLAQHCLAKDPAHRYASGADLAAAIGRVLGSPSMATAQTAGGAASVPIASGNTAPTLSSAAGAAAGARARTGSRGAVFAVAAILVIVGGVAAVVATRGGGGPASPTPPAPAPAVAPASPAAAAVAAPTSPPAVVVPPAPVAPASPDPSAELSRPMKALLSGFAAWSREHAGAPCPRASALGAPVSDPWGHPLELTCSDQPANQIIGAISAGPDGVLGTPDDVGSWQLARDVTDLVHGARWVTKRETPPAPVPPAVAKPIKPAKPAKPAPPKYDDDDIPAER